MSFSVSSCPFPYYKEALVAQLAVQKASLLTKALSEELSSKNTLIKNDKSPVTVGDFAAQAIIISSVINNFPNDKFIAEESSNDLVSNEYLTNQILDKILVNNVAFDHKFGYNHNRLDDLDSIDKILNTIDLGSNNDLSKGDPDNRNKRFWTLDPIDGTKGFLRNDQFAICLALIENNTVQLAVIGVPNLPVDLDQILINNDYINNYNGDLNSFIKEKTSLIEKGGLFTAVKNNGAFFQPLFNKINHTSDDSNFLQESNSIKINMRKDLNSISDLIICEGYEKGHSSHSTQSLIKSKLGISNTPSNSLKIDSQAKYCCLSKGDADVYLRLPISESYQENIWDHASGYLLITESGGTVTDMFGNDLDFTKGRTLKSKGIIASNNQYHDQIIKAVSEVLNGKIVLQ
ncbi:3'(2'),5'-bisphosphate nucleotidase [Ascoidea rubescens DSM 1968]|uniref:3'(2'),5'-bisphosphate nucleotidase n=1 Tax=Ascoidea rubescens DSM 1968 TaxID=1344418 RepID=A0A1D2VE06_9ASCO|nr:3(2),5-bisphosphate nucleotidase HAL2 [Ascoidea rubescens DSM 1968]ODV59938.1 3(2),5-bisphosphate nucleotidase HAL2 [Ascoidea rubescens DSM 1968]